jgi:putative ABC transport system ATP-binding protein
MTELIECSNIFKSYGEGEGAVQALRGVNLVIRKGAMMAIVGRSGSGKSTLLQILGLLDRPTSGRYLWSGEDVSTYDDDRLSDLRGRGIGFVFQQFHLLASLSLIENVALPLVYQGVAAGERMKRASEALDIVQMSHRKHHKPHQLSGGEKQRGAIARAIVHRPSLILADEPTGNLDTSVKTEIMEYLTRLNQELGATVVIVTHDDATAQWARETVTIVDGKVEFWSSL